MVTDDGEDINTPDDIAIFEEGILISKLTIKKLDKSVDLVLFSIDNINKLNITNYAIIANEEPLKAESIYIVGNPVGIEDLLSEGKIINYTDDYVYFYDHSFFGSSGGGIFNLKGELIGTISHLKATINIGLPFVIHGATRQSKIMEFLKDVR
jgi:S1-C subfamily serine protease